MIRLILLFIERFKYIGLIPICNGIASRAPHIGDWCFILCYRCTFIYLFGLMTFLYCIKKNINIAKNKLKYAIALCIPMIIDGGIQTLHLVESTNFRRSLTGALFGIGFMVLLLYLYQYLESKLNKGGKEDVLY